MAALLVLRFADALVWQKTKRGTIYDGQKYVLRFASGTILTALMWCFYCLMVFPHIETIELAFNIIIVAAMAGGAATILGAHKPTAILYSAILLVPFSLALLTSDVHHQYILGLLGLAFSAVMVITAKKSGEFNQVAIRLKNENAILVEHMEEEVEERTNQIYQLSNIDPLTGLFNRTAFLSQLDKHIEYDKKSGGTFALLFIDLDGFKKINDSIGHEAGDRVLQQTAQRLKNSCPDEQLLCRWGGDEFLVGLDQADANSALELAQQLIAKISNPYVFESNRLNLGATVGIAMYPEHTVSGIKLIQLADTAMYFQKKNSPCTAGLFSERLGKQLAREQRLKDALSEAIEEDQLRIVYQPIIDAKTHTTVAFEALLRWNLNNENIPPDEFITIAEQYGLIRKIGNWVLQQACSTAVSWQQHATIAVSVNVSVIQLQDNEFIDFVDSVLAQTELAPECLHIEITESVFAADKEALLEKITALKQRNIHISIDDFGTEYSSLSVIQELSADIVKIDRAFVHSLDTNGLPIVKAVLNIAEAFGYEVIAEGVETVQQANILRDLGVDYLQGFYFCKPLELRALSNFVKSKPLPFTKPQKSAS
ncbi:EAL domain-containing protein [Aliiglaciecola sp. LCG003]|uniref:putative bifunctional diguanylate cyclase/phosphodiesterase n=1 Tax=Aliiglaciecola sp. LCG003 TaxID=3053655 RepID=UPI002573F37F|nr:EAL domain-containing protein [Aliiglaciecola sp. LCG003]WJG08775.1 EAL domain-containing protein [Aliiglaciecola sp. LCG003]